MLGGQAGARGTSGAPVDGGECVDRDGRRGNWKPSKKKSIERIDGIVALIMAAGRVGLQVEFAYSSIIL